MSCVVCKICRVSNVSSKLLVVLSLLLCEGDSFVCEALKFGEYKLLDRVLSLAPASARTRQPRKP
jgi:hypothetical protein